MADHHNHAPVTVDPEAVQSAKDFWAKSAFATKYVIIAICALLLGMAFFLVS